MKTDEDLRAIEAMEAEMLAGERASASEPPATTLAEEGIEERAPDLRPSRAALSSGLGAGAAAWMLGGLFEGWLGRPVALVAVAAGVAWVTFASRAFRSVLAQYGLFVVAFLTGVTAALAIPNSTDVKGTVPTLVLAAIRNGGLLQPPVPFDPGWRFLVVCLSALVGGTLASVALGWRRPALVPLLPLPIVLGAGVLQPRGSELLGGVGALVLVVASLMVVFTAQTASEVSGSRTFELKQAGRGALALVAVSGGLIALSRADLLFPASDRQRDAKPQKPKIVPLKDVPDRVLFTVRAPVKGPWRLGVLDEYGDDTWLLPPFDPDRLVPAPTGPDAVADAGVGRIEATFTLAELEGFTLPGIAGQTAIDAVRGGGVKLDPRLGVHRITTSSPGAGYQYTVIAPAPVTGQQLAAAVGAPPPEIMRFTEAPSPPPGVRELLGQAPQNPWERLQFLRNALYDKAVAAGSGVPIAVPPARVDELLAGGEGTPFEITAGEALLARWAGIPARIGYGFHQGGPTPEGGFEVRPKHGANWLEAWFPDHGWVPVVGVPPRARASLSSAVKNDQVVTRPSEDITLQVYLAYKVDNPLLFYVVVRYWIAVASPFVLAALLTWFLLLPVGARWLRSMRRERWAAREGPAAQISVAYAELRDAARDLNIGSPYDTALEFLDRIAADDEHAELAWLVTRGLWGDLRRDLHDDDVAEAIRLSRSVRQRLARGQTPLTRLLALTSRASLRAPFDPDMPNAWPASRRGARARRRGRAAARLGVAR